MNDSQLLEKIESLAGPQRAFTFRKAAEFILEHDCKCIVETGCYRGTPADGQSTLILAMLARRLDGTFTSFDISQDSIDRAGALLQKYGVRDWANLVHGDSIKGLSQLIDHPVRFAYLDSFDHDPANPGPCQRHQLEELRLLIGRLAPPCGVLLDDHVPSTGGKTALSAAHLKNCGWRLAAEGYQLLFTFMP